MIADQNHSKVAVLVFSGRGFWLTVRTVLRSVALVGFPLCVCVGVSAAQQSTGSLLGRVVDEDGRSIVGAQITATSPSLQGVREATSSEQGEFHFWALPVGLYSVRIVNASGQDVRLEEVVVRLGMTTSLPVCRLNARVAEEVIVIGERALVDVSRATIQTTLESEMFEALPIDRDLESIVALAPQANTSFYGDPINVSGSTGLENVYYIDGVNVTEPAHHEGGLSLPYNFVRAVEVKTGGYEAEFGRSIGGIVNVLTQSGSNEFRGEVFGFFTNSDFAASRERTLLESTAGEFALFDVGGSLGGPIVRDKLWFYGAYNPTFNNAQTIVPDFGAQDDVTAVHLFASKLNWRVTSRTQLEFTAHGNPGSHTGVLPSLTWGGAVTGLANLDPLLVTGETGGYALAAQGSHQLTGDVFLEASVSRVTNMESREPRTEVGLTEPLYQALDGTWSGGLGVLARSESERWAGKLHTSVVAGSHFLKLGIEYEDNRANFTQEFGEGGRRGGGIINENPDSTWTWFVGYTGGDVRNRAPAVFLQDSWVATERLRLNVGLRWDGQFIEGAHGERPFSITDQWQPRIGIVYQADADGRGKFFGSYGRFYQQFGANTPGYFWSDARFLFKDFDCDPRQDSTLCQVGEFEYVLGRVDPDTKGEHFDEFVAGFEQIVQDRFKVGVRGIYRTLREIVEDSVDPETGELILGNPGRGELRHMEKPRRDYAGLELTLASTGRGPLQFQGSYVLSETYGNYPGVANTDLRQNGGNGNWSFDVPEQLVNGTGALPNDRRHVFKLFGSYRLGFGLTAGTWFSVASGSPLSEYGTIPPPPTWVFITQRGTAGQMPTLWDLNMRFTYDLHQHLGIPGQPRMIADLFHVLNQRTVVDVDQRHYLGTDVDGNPIGENPNYLQPVLRQAPFSMRLGLVLGF